MLEHEKIIFDWQELLEKVSACKGKVVFTNGCYDILHSGHVEFLARAKAQGDVLVLALNTDNSVKRLEKGDERPINPLEARAYVAAHLASTDFVTCFDEDTPYELIKFLQPDILVKGGDWSTDTIVGRDIVLAKGGQVKSLPFLDGFSTTSVVEKIKKYS